MLWSSMIELRLTADAKRIASMRDAIRRECARSNIDPEHAETIVFVAEQLALGDRDDGRRERRRDRRSELFVILTLQSDEALLMVREAQPRPRELGPQRVRLLH